jgi:hypothetical protein
MSAELSLSALAGQIAASAKAIEEALKKKGAPLPSFDKDAPPMPADPEILFAKMQLLDAVHDLRILVNGPEEYIFNQSVVVSGSIEVIRHL